MVTLLVVLALIVIAAVILGAFLIKWLFILAVVAALIWLIMFFARGASARL
jgi:hypothetical protein